MSIKWDECSRSFIDDEFNAWSYTGEPGTWKPRIGNPKEQEQMARKKKEEVRAVDFDALTTQDEVWPEVVNDVYPDQVLMPAHYLQGRQYEPWDVVADWGLDYFLGNALKYICRAGRKTVDAREDIQKAITYLRKKLGML
jgi:hypothetical protein